MLSRTGVPHKDISQGPAWDGVKACGVRAPSHSERLDGLSVISEDRRGVPCRSGGRAAVRVSGSWT